MCTGEEEKCGGEWGEIREEEEEGPRLDRGKAEFAPFPIPLSLGWIPRQKCQNKLV